MPNAAELAARVERLAASLRAFGQARARTVADCEDLLSTAIRISEAEEHLTGDVRVLQAAVEQAGRALISCAREYYSVPAYSFSTAVCRFGRACKHLLAASGDEFTTQHSHPVTYALAEHLLSTGLFQLQCVKDKADLASGRDPPLDVAAAALEAQLAVMPLLLSEGQLSAGETFEAATRDALLAAWLVTALGTLQALQAAAATAPAPVKERLERAHLDALPAVCCMVYCNPPEVLHPALLEQDVTHHVATLLLAALPRLAVALSLPPERRPARVGWDSALSLMAAFSAAPLASTLRSQLAADPGTHAAALSAAATLLQQLPLDAAPPRMLPTSHAALPAMLGYFLGAISAEVEAAALWAADGPHRRRLAPQLARAYARLPGILQLMASSPSLAVPMLGEVTGTAKSQLIAATYSILGQSMPRLFGAPVGILPDGGLPPTAVVRSLGDVAEWATAAAAGLRCAPLLASIDTLEAAAAPGVLLHNAAGLAMRIATSASLYILADSLRGEPAPGRAAGLAAARAAIWQLHTTACRLVHWGAAADGRCSLAHPELASVVLCTLGDLMRCGRDLHGLQRLLQPGGAALPPRTNKELEAMAAAHWEAVRVLDAVGAVAQLNFPEAWTKLAESLAICMAEGPLVLAADEGLHSLYARVSEHTTPELESLDRYQLIVFSACAQRLAAFLVTSGRLEAMLRQAEQDITPGRMSPAAAERLCSSLTRLAVVVPEEVEAIPNPDPALMSAVHRLGLGLLATASLDARPPAAALANFKQQLLPPLAELAEGLQAWQALPEQQQEVQLQAAQVATARACAYLRCANVSQGGGPAAGEGEGSSKCSGCRTAWYCSEACSHADWRTAGSGGTAGGSGGTAGGGGGGHRRVCKALAEARRLERQRRQQQGSME